MKMHTTATRSGGKQIDTWKFDIADAPRQEVTVSLITSQGKSHFEARGKTELVKGMVWSDSDIANLQSEVQQEVLALANDLLDACWKPAFVVKSNIQPVGGDKEKRFSLNLSWSETKRDTSKPPSNTGEHDVLNGVHMSKILERAHNQVFETKKNDLTQENFRRIDNEGSNVAIVDGSPENLEALQDLRAFMRLFSTKVLDRLTPNQISMLGVPEPNDIVDLMLEAKEDFDAGERAAEDDPKRIFI